MAVTEKPGGCCPFWGAAGLCMLFTALTGGLLMALVTIFASIHKIDSTHMAVTWNPFTRNLTGIVGEGLHFSGYQKYVAFPSTVTTIEANVSCVTQDGLVTNLWTAFLFQIRREDLITIAFQYRNFDKYSDVMTSAALRGVHYACAQFLVSQFQGQRYDVQEATKHKLQALVDELLHADITDVQLKNVDPPWDWKSAVSDKLKAQQDTLLAANERDQRVFKANGDLALAQQQAQITLQTAQATAVVTLTTAQNNAKAMTLQYQTQADIAANITRSNNLTIDGYIAYLENRLLESSSGLDVAIDTPAAGVAA